MAGLPNISDIREMQAWSDHARREGKRIVMVPTMGFLHEGHLSLVRQGRKKGDCLVVSIFANPMQFAPTEDFDSYPRDLERDVRLLVEERVDLLFNPTPEDMYPRGFQTYVDVEQVSRPLCGAYRPGHFRGVATVVLKLFNIARPHVAMFGLKDYQQVQVIRRMSEDLNLDVEIVACPTVREPDGLAMSSRNRYLGRPSARRRCVFKAPWARPKRWFAAARPRLKGFVRRWWRRSPANPWSAWSTRICATPRRCTRWKRSRVRRCWPSAHGSARPA